MLTVAEVSALIAAAVMIGTYLMYRRENHVHQLTGLILQSNTLLQLLLCSFLSNILAMKAMLRLGKHPFTVLGFVSVFRAQS